MKEEWRIPPGCFPWNDIVGGSLKLQTLLNDTKPFHALKNGGRFTSQQQSTYQEKEKGMLEVSWTNGISSL
jgi:hypothetical protein